MHIYLHQNRTHDNLDWFQHEMKSLIYRAEKKSSYVVWWSLFLLLLITSAWTCPRHSRNHVQGLFLSSVYLNDQWLSVLSDYYSNNIAVPFYEENWYQVSHSIPQNFDIIPFSLSLENHTKCRLIISIITTWAKGNGNCTATRPHYPTLWLRAALSHLWEATHHKQSDDLQPR